MKPTAKKVSCMNGHTLAFFDRVIAVALFQTLVYQNRARGLCQKWKFQKKISTPCTISNYRLYCHSQTTIFHQNRAGSRIYRGLLFLAFCGRPSSIVSRPSSAMVSHRTCHQTKSSLLARTHIALACSLLPPPAIRLLLPQNTPHPGQIRLR